MKIIITIFGLLILLNSCTIDSNKQKEFPNIFQIKSDSFQINNNRDTILEGRKGTKLKIYKNTFNSQNIKIVLQEFYSKSDFLKSGLTTTSGNKILVSKGMIKIQAFDGEKEINELLKEIEIQFPENPKKQFKIFYGKKNQQYIDWQEDTISQYYNIIENTILVGKYAPFGNFDYASDTVIIDSIPWNKNYNQYDTILTFQESSDTMTWPEIWNEDADKRVLEKEYNNIFKTTKLDWINCDAFMNFENLVDVIIKTDYSGYPFAFAVFEKQNSIVPGYLSNSGTFEFGKLPIGEKFTFIVIDKVDNLLFLDYHKNIVIVNDLELIFKLKETKLEDIKLNIENIDK